MTKEIFICFNAGYMSYGRPSHKALCSMAPRNCPWEMREPVKLKTGKTITIYYCAFEKEKVEEIKPGVLKSDNLNNKTSCRLDGG